MKIDHKSVPALVEAVRYLLESFDAMGMDCPLAFVTSDVEDRLIILRMAYQAVTKVIDHAREKAE